MQGFICYSLILILSIISHDFTLTLLTLKEEPPPSFNELYATRPLPPIPTSSVDHQANSTSNSSARLDRQTVVDQSLAYNLTGRYLKVEINDYTFLIFILLALKYTFT